MTDVLIDDATTAVGETRPFEALMTVEGRWTGDERIIMVDALSWDGLLPMPLTVDHGGVRDIVGRVDEIARTPGATPDERFIFGKGVIDLGSELGQETARQIEGGFLRGVSVMTDAIKEGGVDPEDPAIGPTDDPSWMMVTESARIRSLSPVAEGAFAEAYITFGSLSTEGLPPAIDGPTPLGADELPDQLPDDEIVIIAAAGHIIEIPRVPPAEWFDEPTDVAIEGLLTVTDDGRVYGLLAPANVPFIGDPSIRGVPMGNVDYSRFKRGEAIVAGGGRVVAGNITMGCGHSKNLTRAAAIEHHDNSCAVVAQVNVGERYASPAGVWVAGALLASVTADQVQRMTTLALSGEWAPTPNGGYELLNALLVPMPAFMIGRRQPSVTMHDGAIAASAIPVQFEDCGCDEETITTDNGFGEVIATLTRRVEALEATARPLASVAAAAIIDRERSKRR